MIRNRVHHNHIYIFKLQQQRKLTRECAKLKLIKLITNYCLIKPIIAFFQNKKKQILKNRFTILNNPHPQKEQYIHNTHLFILHAMAFDYIKN